MTRFIRTLGLTVLATLAIPAFAQDSIAPPTFSATIPIGTSATVNKVVTIGQVLKPVDILFVVDTTGSMGPTLSAVAHCNDSWRLRLKRPVRGRGVQRLFPVRARWLRGSSRCESNLHHRNSAERVERS